MGNDKEVTLNQEFTQHLQDINVQMNDIIKTGKNFLNEVDRAKSEISKTIEDEISKAKEEILIELKTGQETLLHHLGRSETTRRGEGEKENQIDLAEAAREQLRHTEAVAQSRLNNYLIAVSIIFLSWATVYKESPIPYQPYALYTLVILGGLLSIIGLLLGVRQYRFVDLHRDTIFALEERLSSGGGLQNDDYRIWSRGADLRGSPTGVERRHHGRKRIKLRWLEKGVTQTSALWLVPAVFTAAFLALAGISFVFTPNTPVPQHPTTTSTPSPTGSLAPAPSPSP